MDIVNERYNKKIEQNENDKNNEQLNEIIKLVSDICKANNIEQLESFVQNNDKEGFFKKLFTMITLPDGDLHETYNDISWELVHSLVQSLNQSSADWDIKNHTLINSTCKNILNIIDWISNNCSAREFLLIAQEFDGSSFISLTLFTKISMIVFTKNALKRIPTEKRFNFLKSILPPLLKILEVENIEIKKDDDEDNENINNFTNDESDDDDDDGSDDDDDSDDDVDDENKRKKQPIKIIGPDVEQELQQKNTENDTKWEYPLSCILDFIYSFALDLKAQDTNDDPNSGISTPRAINRTAGSDQITFYDKPNTPIAQQQHLFLFYLVKILSMESILNPPQSLLCNGTMPLLGVIGECLSLIGASTSYILGTDSRFRLKKREIELEDMYYDEGLDEDDFQNDQDLNLNDPNKVRNKLKSKKLNSNSNQSSANTSKDIGDDDDDNNSESDYSSSSSYESEGEEEEEEKDDGFGEDEYSSIDKLFDLDLPYSGIGHYLFLLILKPTDQFRLPSLQSIHSILMDNLPYLISLLQCKSYRIGFKAIQILSFLQKRLKVGSIDINQEFCKNPIIEDSIQEIMLKATEQHGGNLKNAIEQSKLEKEKRHKWIHDQSTTCIERNYHFLQLIESIIGFMVRCPVQQMRSFTYRVLMLLIGQVLTPSTKFNILYNLIGTCIFPSFTGLLIHIFKEEINKAWSSTIVDERCYFVSPKILDVVTIPIQTGGNLMERMDSIMNGLNMYRFLLIRDKGTNHTGIWSKSKIQGSRETCFYPLRKDLLDVQSQFRASSQGDEKAMEKVLSGVSKMGVNDLSKDDIKNASTLVCYHIDMALDVITRILELQDTLIKD
ncbi:hypothetical protein DDB_G0269608 [Dictyostelium discoideum AX4]|uniref:Uncharacterized protein n=1 Tax=Dictyostelium discoideum TaxID=44689 RepID=Q55DM0_DICDI|nr:hypothetical protein DDB_G0269608 [Dictyostelium discoideum AX4]EAL72154.1 hypothetical protein DDB_G0269608 [Dictyostelium discoideum AX4]|eukprot:XP_646111.1 hypothetical protein DDB_G0269608 [Dictyostelium discoideum AX4]